MITIEIYAKDQTSWIYRESNAANYPKLRSSEWSRLFWAGRISHFLEGELFANE
jgi:hypothetical protein